MFKACPNPVDVEDLQFKLRCRLKVFDNESLDPYKQPHNLISCASRYGLLFVGTNTPTLQIIQLQCTENYTPKDKDIADYPRRTINLPSIPKHVSVNCDSTILAVVIESNNVPVVLFYDVLSFLKQNIQPLTQFNLSNNAVKVTDLNWNPSLPQVFTACKSDGSLSVLELSGNSVKPNELPAAAGACCFCWSPKGKQIAVGSKDGKITQYKPDLKAVKVINAPPLQGVNSLISLQWVSNYQFIGIFSNLAEEPQINVIVVDAPKTGEPSYTNYEDICYSNGNRRSTQFYLNFQAPWNLLMAASANSTELGVLSSTGETWTQLYLSDTARAELPLSADSQETLPLGLALDVSSTKPLPWCEGTIPPAPVLLILSHNGVLCLFNVVNLKAGIPSICTPPDAVQDVSGLSQFVKPAAQPQVLNVPKSEPAKPTISFGMSPATSGGIFGTPQAATSIFAPPTTSGVQTTTPINKTTQETTTSKPSMFGGFNVVKPVDFTAKKPEETQPKPTQFGQSTTLFGGQATITPVKLQQPTATVQKTDISTTSSAPAAQKYSSILSALQTPTTGPAPSAAPTASVTILTPGVPQKTTDDVPKVATSESKPEIDPVLDAESKAEMEAQLSREIREECMRLESELQMVLEAGRKVNTNLGTDAEKNDTLRKIESLTDFCAEVSDNVSSQNADAHYLKQNLIQSWAWYEEALSRFNVSKDKTMNVLLRAQPLDSASEKVLTDIKKHICYLDSQLSQASKALDEQWDQFQDFAKNCHRKQMPTMEAIFQAMVRQNAIMQKQSYIMKDISARMKMKYRTATTPSLLVAIENLDIENDLKNLSLDPKKLDMLHYEKINARTKQLKGKKSQQLRQLLKHREVSHVTVLKPELSNSLMQQSPLSISSRRLSLLGAQMSPVVNSLPKKLNFVQSTPCRDLFQAKVPSNAPAPVATSQDTSFLFNNPNVGFLPVSKTGQTSQPGSAFVQASNATFIKPKTTIATAPLITKPVTVTKPVAQPIISITTWGGNVPLNTNASSFAAVASKTSTQTTFSLSGGGIFTAPKPAEPKTPSSTTDVKTSQTSVIFSNNAGQSNSTSSFSFGSSNIGKSAFTVVPSSEDNVKSGSSTSLASTSSFGSIVSASSTSNTELSKPAFETPSFGTQSTAKFSFGGAPAVKTDTPAVSSSESAAKTTVAVSTSTATSKFSFTGFAPASTTTSKPATPTTAVTSKPLFGAPAASTTTSLFGGAVSTTIPTTISLGSLFGSAPTTSTPTTKPIFSGFTTGGSTSIFGASTPTKPTTTAQSPAVSEKGPTVTTTSSSLFGSEPQLFGATSSLLGKTTSSSTTTATSGLTISPAPSSSAPSTTSSVFGTTVSVTTPATTVTSTGPSIFGSSASSTGLFSAAASTTSVASTANIFGSTTAASAVSSPASSTATTTTPSIFGTASSATTTTPSAFGSSPATSSTSIFASTPAFGAATTSAPTTSATTAPAQPAFGGGSLFGAKTTTTASIFGSTSAAPATTSVSLFGSTSAATASSPFGTPVSSTSGGVFGGSAPTSNVFGSAAPAAFGSTTAATTAAPIFGSAVTTSASIFGAPATTAPSLFGSAATTTTQSVFGSVSTTSSFGSAAPASPFGQQQPSAFGTPTTTAFGTPTTTSGFGTPVFGSGSVFGTPTTTATSFGQSSTFGGGSQSIFGGTPTTTTNVFGGTPTTTTNVFGGTPTTSSQPFGSGSIFGTPTSSTNVFGGTQSNAFGAPATQSFATSGSFGFGSLDVSGGQQSGGNVFGSSFGQQQNANPFGRTAVSSSSGNIFGSPASTASSIFGGASSSNSIFGGSGTQTFGAFSGGAGTFGSTQAASGGGPFSGSGASAFGGGGSTQQQSAGPFSGGASSGFGSPAAFPKPAPAFGGSPAFGASPAFGSAPSFGGAPAFGSPSTFGSPTKVFGGGTAAGPSTFGSAAAQSPTFGNLANQNTVGFGNLAQQTPSNSGNSSFSGGSSFSNWR